ncbi:hypothetical protein H4R18_005762 [Coemansia javaensis]|uniref:Uncharacterized protein n=1 Tax=Coemansia javaensis TaxID=2761396 RepID=A0A9W8H5C3_9FUNG|nr:hypothetical protein H4R18_005762 [Coemansia javaensis]
MGPHLLGRRHGHRHSQQPPPPPQPQPYQQQQQTYQQNPYGQPTYQYNPYGQQTYRQQTHQQQNPYRPQGDPLASSQFVPGEPGGFVPPPVPGVRDSRLDGGYGASPLGFVMPTMQGYGNGYPTDRWGGAAAYPPTQPLPVGEPGGFVMPGAMRPQPHQCVHHQQNLPPPPPSVRAPSRASWQQNRGLDASYYPADGGRRAPSRQESHCSWNSAASQTLVGSAYPQTKEQQQQQQPGWTGHYAAAPGQHY